MDHELSSRHQQVLYDKKWQKFLGRARIFRYIPFVGAVFGAGSMAIGNVRPTSDFDVIVLAKYGRIFTARVFLILTLDLFGWRRKNLDHNRAASDTICPNHFITEKSYCLAGPHEEYWKLLYKNLVPIFGPIGKIRDFWKANSSWLGEVSYHDDLRHKFKKPSVLKIFFEKLLGGKLGDWFEGFSRTPQLRKIKSNLVAKAGYKPRLIYTDQELELHLDTRRIEEFVEREER